MFLSERVGKNIGKRKTNRPRGHRMVIDPKKGKCPKCGCLTLIYIDNEIHTEWCEDCGWEQTVSWNELGPLWWSNQMKNKGQ
mgnify:FL=1